MRVLAREPNLDAFEVPNADAGRFAAATANDDDDGPLPRIATVAHGPVPLDDSEPVDERGWRWLSLQSAGRAVALLAALAAVVTGILVYLTPASVVGARLLEATLAATGYDVRAKRMALSMFPRTQLVLEGVSIARHAGEVPLVEAPTITVELGLAALLMGRADVGRITVQSPRVDLVVSRLGLRNWEQGTPASGGEGQGQRARPEQGATEREEFERLVRLAATAEPTARAARVQPRPARRLPLGEVLIHAARVGFRDDRSGAAIVLESLDLTLGNMDSVGGATAKGTLIWQGERIALDGRIVSLSALLGSLPTRLTIGLESARGTFAYDGAIAVGNGPVLDGTVTATAHSVGELGRWVEGALPVLDPRGRVRLKGRIRASERGFSIAEATAEVGELTATGAIGVETGGTRPLVKATLRLSALDLDRLFSAAAVTPPAAGTAKALGKASGRAVVPPLSVQRRPPPASIEDLIARSTESERQRATRDGVGEAPLAEGGPQAHAGPRVQGFLMVLAGARWSSTPLDASGLGLVDVEARVVSSGVTGRGARVGAIQAHVSLKQGALTLTVEDAQAFEGRMRGVLALARSPEGVSVGASVVMEDVEFEPLLAEALDVDLVAGRGRLHFALAGAGRTQREIVERLQGRGELRLGRGMINGWRLGELVAAAARGSPPLLPRRRDAWSEFSELSLSFTTAAGIFQSQDLKMLSPTVSMSGAGMVHLPLRQIDYRIRPRLVAAATSRGLTPLSSGLELPVRIHGPWSHPSYEAEPVGADGRVQGRARPVLEALRAAAGGADAAAHSR